MDEAVASGRLAVLPGGSPGGHGHVCCGRRDERRTMSFSVEKARVAVQVCADDIVRKAVGRG